ncbi:130aa long hypothetical protein [Pyrococcus horikoshii OT3]|uniref:Putative uncharacterized protein PH1631 n=1 Tax=Pyrococcus horikoshii (strain ATCC 700860 / DSM 12428 / JCM 9974 / NBRC 100139 / OT-3) TaxID=70601 RepID=Y1631_PYRHO|nr:PUTATIVE PSEUDOGENE: RecName: Full=Putative uncharacterized protein PH1631 [Pyrococcus horikoshii OT3]BAA30743.1 130aa long hypothetical protein [Pyrococcus horikoshii OT3]
MEHWIVIYGGSESTKTLVCCNIYLNRIFSTSQYGNSADNVLYHTHYSSARPYYCYWNYSLFKFHYSCFKRGYSFGNIYKHWSAHGNLKGPCTYNSSLLKPRVLKHSAPPQVFWWGRRDLNPGLRRPRPGG